jgi:hypothetical protein
MMRSFSSALVALMLGLSFAVAPTGARAADDPPAGKTAHKKSKGGAKTAKPRPRTARSKPAAAPIGVHPIAENVQVTPFPSHADAARKALAQNRRDQLEDAEKVARAAKQDDRWQTVLFDLRSLDARSDVEACFWRAVAFYRLGEMARARSTRQLCTLSAKEEASLDAEDALSGSMQPAAPMPEMLAAGERPPAPVPNPNPYAGASPAKIER